MVPEVSVETVGTCTRPSKIAAPRRMERTRGRKLLEAYLYLKLLKLLNLKPELSRFSTYIVYPQFVSSRAGALII